MACKREAELASYYVTKEASKTLTAVAKAVLTLWATVQSGRGVCVRATARQPEHRSRTCRTMCRTHTSSGSRVVPTGPGVSVWTPVDEFFSKRQTRPGRAGIAPANGTCVEQSLHQHCRCIRIQVYTYHPSVLLEAVVWVEPESFTGY